MRKLLKQFHENPWILAIVGFGLAGILLAVIPSLKVVSELIAVLVLIHLLGGGLILFSLYLIFPAKFRKMLPKRYSLENNDKIFFGLTFEWMNGYRIMGIICLVIALFLFVQDQSRLLQFVSLPLFLLTINLFAGSYVLRMTEDSDYLTLPFVDLFASNKDLLLDAGCGTGRTTIAAGKVIKNGKIVAVDKFDSKYWEGGGRMLLERNLSIAKISDKVQIEKGDVTRLHFENEKFDSAISAYMMDHLGLGKTKLLGLKEINRTLKKDGKFLLIVFVPGWMTFAVANFLSLALTTKDEWKKLFPQAGFDLLEEGAINGSVYFLLKKFSK